MIYRVRRGFTLLELITVILVMGILFGVMTPMFRSSFSNLQVHNAAKNLTATVRFAQAQAIVRAVEYRVCISEKTRSYWVTRQTDPAGDPEKFELVKSDTLRPTFLPESVEMRTVTAPTGEFQEEKMKYISCHPNGRVGQVLVVIAGPDGRKYTIKTSVRMAGIQLIEESAR